MPEGVRACLGRRMALLRPNSSVVDPKFLLYFYLSPAFQRMIARHTIHGATVPRIGLATMPAWKVEIPSLAVQRPIGEVLGALDDKLAANERLLCKLDELDAAEFAEALTAGNKRTLLGDLAAFHNRRRIPLSSRERQGRSGSVPYYGAAGRLDYVDRALFDERLVLVGEDGTVIRQDGRPVVQYVWGPAWVNNHAHVLTGRTISTESLRVALGRANVTHLVTGAVQPKISMGNLKTLALEMPSEMVRLESRIDARAAVFRAISDENKVLAHTRDELLPLLMSGRVRVKDAETFVEEVV